MYALLEPQTFEEVEGQLHLTGPHGILTQFLKNKYCCSIAIYGPSGCGKTTIARLYAEKIDPHFVSVSPLSHGTADLKKIVDDFEKNVFFSQQRRVILVDEIHRFNKAQQDFFLPYLEKGAFILVATTTEKPSVCINQALLSRVKTFPVYALNAYSLKALLERLLKKIPSINLNQNLQDRIVAASCGDARYLVNTLETAIHVDLENTPEHMWCNTKPAVFENREKNLSSLISALQKSIRHSKPNAALYYLARLADGSELLYVARRLIRIACEDIGLADPQAMIIANQAYDAFEKLGSPEGDLILAKCALYLALAPKSARLTQSYAQAVEAAQTSSFCAPADFLQHHKYEPSNVEYNQLEEPLFFPNQELFCDFYQPTSLGFENELKKRMEFFKSLQTKKNLRPFP